MTAKPLTEAQEQSVTIILEAFKGAYLEAFSKTYAGFNICLPAPIETRLIAGIAPHLGTVPSDATTAEILSEIQQLHTLDGRTFEHEGEEYEPVDDAYPYVLADREEDREQFIRHLIQQAMK
ncbi:hypothetical protein [Glutamicibacter ardleyensis]|uniref:hypothetical protein n=1 Tax=Glutamicibacter ardleyensis TaxID=225894 RepID=UPI003FD412D4